MFQANCNDRKREKGLKHERDFDELEDKSLSNLLENLNFYLRIFTFFTSYFFIYITTVYIDHVTISH